MEDNWLDYAQHQFYDRFAGRFTNPEPLGRLAFVLLDPQTINAYTYVRDDPVNRTAPLGLVDSDDDCWDIGDGWSECTGGDGKAICSVH